VGRSTTIYKGIGVFIALTMLTAEAHAGSAPKELYGKSITVQWSESITGRQGASKQRKVGSACIL
jgi:hypothetical protein